MNREVRNLQKFVEDVRSSINRHSIDNELNTPDYVIALHVAALSSSEIKAPFVWVNELKQGTTVCKHGLSTDENCLMCWDEAK